MSPYRTPPGKARPAPSRLRKTTLLAFGLGLTVGVGLGPVAAVMALHSAAAPPSAAAAVPIPVPIPITVVPDQLAAPAPSPPASPTEAPAPERSRMTPEQARATIAAQADRVMKALRAHDTTALAGMIDADEGLALDPFAEGTDVPRLDVAGLRGCFEDRRVRTWGDRGNSNANDALTCAAYWKKYLAEVDLAPSDVTYNELRTSDVDGASQLGVAVDDLFVRYFFTKTNGSTQVITLVFAAKGRAWKLDTIARQRPADEVDCDAP